MDGGTIYDGRPSSTGGRPPTTDPERAKTRRDAQITAAILGTVLLIGICCGGCLFAVAARLIDL